MLIKNIPPTPKMVNEVKSTLKDNVELQQIDFNGKKYTISIENGKCVSLTRDDKKWYKSVSDFFSRGFTSGQSAFTPRAHQLKMAVDRVLLNKEEPIHMSLEEVKYGTFPKVESKLSQDTIELWDRLEKLNKDNNKYYSAPAHINRYPNILSRKSTQLDKNLNANKISIAGGHIANAGQYPKDEQIAGHLKMLADNKTSCLVVLASNNDIVKSNSTNHFTDYFITNSSYATSTLIKENYNLGSSVLADSYVLKTQNSEGEDIEIPVIHVVNWPDKKSISSSALIEMAGLVTETAKINKEINNISLSKDDKWLPFVHCKAGVGRTGTFIAEYYMSNNPDNNVSLESIIEDMRASRNNHMVQTPEQLDTLVEICKAQNRPIFKPDEEPIYANIS
ncbi:TPA: protein-tyrosine phosphatase family protein [Yersinia enterocolitica]